MICPSPRCLFVHIPKTAGQSIERFFLERNGLSWDHRQAFLLYVNQDPDRGPVSMAHLTAEEYVTLGHLSEQQFRSYYRFTFVRNPWARIASEYRYRKLDRQGVSFETYLSEGLPQPGFTDEYRHIIPQYDYVYSRDGEQLVDFVGRFERLQEDFDRVCHDLGIPAERLPHVNASRPAGGKGVLARIVRSWRRRRSQVAGGYRGLYNAETRQRVEQLYAKDIQAFGYTFDDGDDLKARGAA